MPRNSPNSDSRTFRIGPTAFSVHCWTRAVADQLHPALADCNESLRLDPKDAATLNSRGFTCLKLGRFDAAIAEYDAALRIFPEYTLSLFGRGVARRKKGDLAGGNADIAAAKAIQSDIAEELAVFGLKEF